MSPQAPLKELDAGTVQLLSFVTPGLFSGDYTIEAVQTVVHGKEKADLHTIKPFSIPGLSAYRLPPGAVYSFYPAEGETVEPRILPHVVLSDAHLPWEIQIDQGKGSGDDSRIPWLALMVFTAEELKPPGSSLPLTMTPTLSARLTKKELTSLSGSGDKLQIPVM